MPSIYVDRVDIASPQKLEWQDGSLCAQVGMDMFFPEKGGSYAEARKVCGGCDVRLKCEAWILALESGKDEHSRHGMFAGLTAKQRFDLDPLTRSP